MRLAAAGGQRNQHKRGPDSEDDRRCGGAAEKERNERRERDKVDREKPAQHGPLEQRIANQEQRRSTDNRERRAEVRAAAGMREHDLVSYGGDDDPGDHGEMEVGVGEAGEATRLFGVGDALRGSFSRDVEVDPPHGHRGAEGGNHRRDDRDGPGEAGEGRAGDEKRFAEGDDDEEPAAFGEMGAFDRPIGDRRASELREPEAHGWANVFDRQGGNPDPTRSESCAKAPAIQNTPANASQSVMRVKFNRNARSSRPA